MKTKRYRAFQLLIDSEIPLAGFPASREEGLADLHVRLGGLGPAPQAGVPWTVSETEIIVWMTDVGAFCAREGREIIVDPGEDAANPYLGLAVRGTMLAAIMLQRGCFPLHASCVESSLGAVLLVGPVGVGKSTLAALLNSQCFRLVCDDLAVLQNLKGKAEVMATVPELALSVQGLRAFEVAPEQWGEPVVAGVPKFRVGWTNWCPNNQKPRAIVFLNQSHDAELELLPLVQSAALLSLGRSLYRVRFLAHLPGLHGALRQTLETLVRGASSYTLTYPSDLARSPEACELLLEQLKTLKPTPQVHWSQQLPLPQFSLSPEKTARPDSSSIAGMALLASYPKSGNTWVRSLLSSWEQE